MPEMNWPNKDYEKLGYICLTDEQVLSLSLNDLRTLLQRIMERIRCGDHVEEHLQTWYYLTTHFCAYYEISNAICALRRMPYSEYLKSDHWQVIRGLALDTYGEACQICGSTRRIEVHHVSYDRRGEEEMEDLQILCRKCHSSHHGKPE